MTYDELMETLRICSVGTSTDCDACRLHGSHDCHTVMARAALDALNAKGETIDQRQTVLKTVEMALDKGGYSVTITPDCEVRLMPWGETARWIKESEHKGYWHCSVCGYRYIVGIVGRKFKFCPLCGARMDGDSDDE